MSSSRWRDSDTASFLSTNTDPLSSPTDGYFSNRGQPDDMYIDTEAANKGAKPSVTVSSATRYSEETTPLLETFVGQDPPPSYLEATTPNPWNGRSSGDEASRLLEDGGRRSFAPMLAERDGMHKDGPYRRRSIREHCTKKRMLKWLAAILAIVILAAIIAAATNHRKQVRSLSSIV